MVNNASVLGSLSAKFKHSSGIRINKLAVNTHGRVNGEVFMDDVVDGATVNVKFEDGNAGQDLGGKDYKQSGSVSAPGSRDCVTDLSPNACSCSSFFSFFATLIRLGLTTRITACRSEPISTSSTAPQ